MKLTQFVISGNHPELHYRIFRTKSGGWSVNLCFAETFDNVESARSIVKYLDPAWNFDVERKYRW